MHMEAYKDSKKLDFEQADSQKYDFTSLLSITNLISMTTLSLLDWQILAHSTEEKPFDFFFCTKCSSYHLLLSKLLLST